MPIHKEGQKSECRVCGEKTKTRNQRVATGYVMEVCQNCGADKRDCGSAPV